MNQNYVVLFGINADPPHLGHLKVIHEVEKHLGQKTLFVVVPTGDHPFAKKQFATNNDRLAMTQILFGNHRQVIVDDFEIKKKTKAFTLDTIKHLKTKYDKARLFFIMAIDVANHFFSWHEPDKILQLATPIIVSRHGYHLDPEVRKKLEKYSHVMFLNTESLDISSTEIRQELKNQNSSEKIPKSVLDYIRSHHLYQ